MKNYNFSHQSVETTTHENYCCRCGESNIITVDKQALANWKNGMFIQDAFPNLTVGEREIILTGIHDVCWDIMFE
jgi:hypothetical protein